MSDRYSHDYACTLEGIGTYRIAVRRGGEREIHIEDAERVARALQADQALCDRHWLLAFLLPPASEWSIPASPGAGE